MEAETPAESIVLDEPQNQSFLGSKLGSAHPFRKNVVFQQLRKRRHGLTLVTFFKGFHERGLEDSELGFNSFSKLSQ